MSNWSFDDKTAYCLHNATFQSAVFRGDTVGANNAMNAMWYIAAKYSCGFSGLNQ